MHIPHNNKQNYSLCKLKLFVKGLKTASLEPTNLNSIKVPKVIQLPVSMLKKKSIYSNKNCT